MLQEIAVRDKTIIRRRVNAVRCVSRILSSAERVVRHYVLLAMCEQYADAQPSNSKPRRQHSALNYPLPAD